MVFSSKMRLFSFFMHNNTWSFCCLIFLNIVISAKKSKHIYILKWHTVVCKIVHKISFLVHEWEFTEGGNEGGRVATPTSFSIFDSCGIKSLWFKFGHDIFLYLLQNGKSFKLGCHFMKWNWRLLSLKSWPFEASEDIMTKFKSQALHIIKIKY